MTAKDRTAVAGMDRQSVDHLPTTTRAVRRRLDFARPVEPEILKECIDIAIQAPSGLTSPGGH